jgi:hypothetical protein
LIKHHSRCEHSLPNDFDVKDLFHKLKDLWREPMISFFSNEFMHPLQVCN